MYDKKKFIEFMKPLEYDDLFIESLYKKCTQNSQVVVSGDRNSGKTTLIDYLHSCFPNILFVENYGDNNIVIG